MQLYMQAGAVVQQMHCLHRPLALKLAQNVATAQVYYVDLQAQQTHVWAAGCLEASSYRQARPGVDSMSGRQLSRYKTGYCLVTALACKQPFCSRCFSARVNAWQGQLCASQAQQAASFWIKAGHHCCKNSPADSGMSRAVLDKHTLPARVSLSTIAN